MSPAQGPRPAPGPGAFYRRFRPTQLNDCADSSGRKFVSSNIFVTRELSVDDGALCSVQECAARGQPDGGVCAVAKSLVSELELVAKPSPEADNAAHVIIEGIKANSTGKRKAAILRDSSIVVHQPPGLVVVDGGE